LDLTTIITSQPTGTDNLITPTDFVHSLRDLRNATGTHDIGQDASALESAITLAAAAATGGGSQAPGPPSPVSAVAPVFGQMSMSSPTTPRKTSPSLGRKDIELNRQGTMDEVSGAKKKGLFGKLKFGK
jgi:hypothetical protein